MPEQPVPRGLSAVLSFSHLFLLIDIIVGVIADKIKILLFNFGSLFPTRLFNIVFAYNAFLNDFFI